jgi:hypothetical protein
MTTGTSPNPPMTIRLKTDVFNRFVELYGWKSDGDIARAIGISRPQVQRTRTGKQSASETFIASFLTAVPEAGFYETFEIVPTTDKEGT